MSNTPDHRLADQVFNPLRAVRTALSRVAKMIASSGRANAHRRSVCAGGDQVYAADSGRTRGDEARARACLDRAA